MSDSPEKAARKQKLLADLIKLSEEAGLYEDEATPEEIVATVKQVRKEMAEERQKANETVVLLTEGEHK